MVAAMRRFPLKRVKWPPLWKLVHVLLLLLMSASPRLLATFESGPPSDTATTEAAVVGAGEKDATVCAGDVAKIRMCQHMRKYHQQEKAEINKHDPLDTCYIFQDSAEC